MVKLTKRLFFISNEGLGLVVMSHTKLLIFSTNIGYKYLQSINIKYVNTLQIRTFFFFAKNRNISNIQTRQFQKCMFDLKVHYTPSQSVTKLLSPHSITECYQNFITTLHHRVLPKFYHNTPSQSVTKVLSLHSITECYQSFITTLHHRVIPKFYHNTPSQSVTKFLSLHSITECY